MGISGSSQVGIKTGVCTSGTRPASPYVGQTVYESDTTRTIAWSGSAWLSVTERTVTSLPTSPLDGEIVNYVADATNGVVWRLKYRSASASSYKWEFIGGSPLISTASGSVTTTSVANTVSLTGGPIVTLPLAGDYRVDCGATVNTANAGNLVGFYVKNTNDGDVSWVALTCNFISSTSSAGTTYGNSIATSLVKTGQAASTTLEMRYAVSNSGSTGVFYNRFLKVTPVRVG